MEVRKEGAGKLESRGMESVAAALAGRDCKRIKAAKGLGIRLEIVGAKPLALSLAV